MPVDVKGMVNDPQFGQLPLGEQKRALTMADPAFGQLGDADFIRAVNGIKGAQKQASPMYQRLAPSPAAVAQQQLGQIPQPQLIGGMAERFAQSALPATGNILGGVGKMALGGPAYMAYQGVKQGIQDYKNPPTQQEQLGRAGGIDAKQLGEQIQAKNYAGAAGSVVPTIAAALVGGKIAGKIIPKVGGAGIDAAETATKITNKVNPPPKQMNAFQADLQKQLPNVVDHAQQIGAPLNAVLKDPSSLAQTLRSAAQEKYTTYYQKMLGPVKDVPVDVSNISYDGAVQAKYPVKTATLSQMDNRLTQINATLSPKYAKGGMAAQAAVTAEQTAALNAEAAQIRTKLYSEIGQRTGIDPKVIADTKNSMGSMNSLAEKVETAVAKQRYAANLRRQELPGKIIKGVAQAGGVGLAGTVGYELLNKR